jgi:hypothetical protein
MKNLESLGRILAKKEQKAIKGGVVNLLSCVCSDGTRTGTGDCSLCYSVCNTHGGISCSEGDCTNWPPKQ